MGDKYPAKALYRGATAHAYDMERFHSLKGRYLDRKEKHSVTRALAPLDRQCTILDLPCGTGRITKHVLALGFGVAGADVSPDMLAVARREVGAHKGLLGYYELDAEAIALEDNSFDCITSVRLMGHLPPKTRLKVLREMARVARQYLIVTFYQAGPLRSAKWLITRRSCMRSAPWYPVKARDLNDLFGQCGLTPEGFWRVVPLLSDGITYRLRVARP